MAGFLTERVTRTLRTNAPEAGGRLPWNRHDPEPSGAPDIAHKPRVEYFDLADLTRTDARGFIHSVDSYHAEPWGLYLVRPADEAPYRYTESWLLPRQSVRVTMSHINVAHDRDPLYHLYLGEFSKVQPKRWRAEYHYIDIIARNGRHPEMRGVDELFAAHSAGQVDDGTARRVFEHATEVIDGLASHDHHVESWLLDQGVSLHWL